MNLTRKHVLALAGLRINPQHLPLDGLCLEELHHLRLIQPVTDGYALTARGEEALAAEEAVARKRPATAQTQSSWRPQARQIDGELASAAE